MPFLPLDIPPGFFSNGTLYQAKGRWHEGNLVRWHEGAMRPVGNWEKLGEGISTTENLALQANRPDLSPWVATTDVTFESRGRQYDLPARAVIAPAGGTANSRISQPVGNLPAGEVTLSVVVEKDTDATAETVIGIYDTDAAGYVGKLTYTWATEAVVVTSDAAGSDEEGEAREMGKGPNTRDMVRLVLTATVTTATNAAEIRFFPVGEDAVEGGAVIYHAQYEHSDEAGSITFTGATAEEQPGGRIEVDRPVFGMLAWKDNSGVGRLAFGTSCRAYIYVDGSLVEVTPGSFTCGLTQAEFESGQYGVGAYGTGVYGEGDTSLEELNEVQSWHFDTFGQFLVGVAHSDGRLLKWELDPEVPMQVVTQAPTDNEGLVVTAERFLVLLGAGGDRRKIQWGDQQSLSSWTPTSTNQAGDFLLPGNGNVIAGRRGRGETLIWTTQDLWSMQFIGGTLVYSFRQIGTECGPISRRSMTVVGGGTAVWMGRRNFFVYDGHVRVIPCEISNAVFENLNRVQASKINCTSVAEFNEIWWFYPSGSSTVVDSYAVYNYVEGFWMTGTLDRMAGVDRGVFRTPLFADRHGVIWAHETGDSQLDFLGNPVNPFAASGPIEIASGDNRMWVRQIVPDEQTLGEVEAKLLASGYPTEAEVEFGPFNPAEPTVVRVSGRQIRLRIDQVTPGWRFGIPRLEIVPAEMR